MQIQRVWSLTQSRFGNRWKVRFSFQDVNSDERYEGRELLGKTIKSEGNHHTLYFLSNDIDLGTGGGFGFNCSYAFFWLGLYWRCDIAGKMQDGSIQSFCDCDQMSCGQRNCVKKASFSQNWFIIKFHKNRHQIRIDNIPLQQKHAHKCKADILSTSTWSLSVGQVPGLVQDLFPRQVPGTSTRTSNRTRTWTSTS